MQNVLLFQGCEIYRNIESEAEIKNDMLAYDEFVPRTSLNDNLYLNGSGITFSLCIQNSCVICDANEKTRNINLSDYQNISELAKAVSAI